MSDTRQIRAVDGRRVRFPGGGSGGSRVLSAPEAVEWSSYWERLLNAGDIEIVPDAPASKPATPTPPAAVVKDS